MINNAGRVVLGVAGVLLVGGCGDGGGIEAGAYQGVVELEERVLGFELGGRLTGVEVNRGDRVEEGGLLATLDPELDRLGVDARQAEVEAAQAQLALLREGARAEDIRAVRAELGAARATEALAERNLERQRQLLTRGAATARQVDELEGQVEQAEARRQALTQQLRAMRSGARSQEIEAAEARVDAARAGLATAEARLARHRLEAGTAGTVLDVHVEPGEVVGAGAPIVTVADLDHPYVNVFVPQADIGGVALGNEARIRVDSHTEPFTGRVEDIARQTEFTPRFLFSPRERPNLVIRVRIRIDDPEHRLHAGVPAFARLGEGQPDGASRDR